MGLTTSMPCALRVRGILTGGVRVATVEENEGLREAVILLLLRPCRLARPRTPPFHGDNMGSNPIGDANEFNCFSISVP